MVQFLNDPLIVTRWSYAGFSRGLIVDDVRSNRLMVEQAMRALGLKTHQACDGKEAFDFLERYGADIVVTDIEMQGGSGLNLLERLRRSKKRELRELPVIVASSLRDQDVVAMVRRSPHAYFIPKPFSIVRLQLTLAMIATSSWLKQNELR